MHDFDCSIIKIANDFYEAYLRCIRGEKWGVDENGVFRGHVVNVPAIVNGSFAIELYLKSLISITSKKDTSKKHNIKILYNMLLEEDKTKLRNQIEQEIKNYGTFNECISGISNSFVYWRYIHEKEDFGFGLNKTLVVIHIFLNNIKNYLDRY